MELKITEMDKEQLIIEIAKIVAQRISIEDIRKRLSDMIYRDILKDIDLKQLTEEKMNEEFTILDKVILYISFILRGQVDCYEERIYYSREN